MELSRGYVVIALPSVTLFDLAARLLMRKRLTGSAPPESACTAWWPSAWPAVADLITELKRDRYHGLARW